MRIAEQVLLYSDCLGVGEGVALREWTASPKDLVWQAAGLSGLDTRPLPGPASLFCLLPRKAGWFSSLEGYRGKQSV